MTTSISTADIANFTVNDTGTADPFAPTDAKQLWPAAKRTATGTRTAGFRPFDTRIPAYAVCEHGSTFVPDDDYVKAQGKDRRHATWFAMVHHAANWCESCKAQRNGRPVNVARAASAAEDARMAALAVNGR